MALLASRRIASRTRLGCKWRRHTNVLLYLHVSGPDTDIRPSVHIFAKLPDTAARVLPLLFHALHDSRWLPSTQALRASVRHPGCAAGSRRTRGGGAADPGEPAGCAGGARHRLGGDAGGVRPLPRGVAWRRHTWRRAQCQRDRAGGPAGGAAGRWPGDAAAGQEQTLAGAPHINVCSGCTAACGVESNMTLGVMASAAFWFALLWPQGWTLSVPSPSLRPLGDQGSNFKWPSSPASLCHRRA